MKEKKVKQRIWMPKCRAATLQDRRTKRNRTRSQQKHNAIKEQQS